MQKSLHAVNGWPRETRSRGHFRRHDQRGAVAALTVLALPVVLIAIALVIDMAYFFLLRTSLQAAADMAALAAAQNVDLDALADGERRLLVERARLDAYQWVHDNLRANKLTAGLRDQVGVHVEVYNADPNNRVRHRVTGRILADPTVSVQLSLDAPTYFAAMIMKNVPIRVMADASLLEKSDPLPYD